MSTAGDEIIHQREKKQILRHHIGTEGFEIIYWLNLTGTSQSEQSFCIFSQFCKTYFGSDWANPRNFNKIFID